MEQNSEVIDKELKRSFTFQNRELLDNYVVLAVTDKQGVIKHVSTNLCNTFKYKTSDLLEKPYSFLIDKEKINSFNNQFDEIRKLKADWKGEIKHSSYTDEVIWTDTIISPLFNDNKENVGFILASSDITKEKKLKKINEENLLRKRHDRTVLDFMPSLSSAVLLKTSSGLHKVLWIIAFTVIFSLVWAYLSKVDDIVRTEGKIITTTNIQNISSLEGGILEKLYVQEGDRVKKGQVLLKLSDLKYKNEYEKNLTNKMSLLAKIERLEAQSQNRKIKINDEVVSFNEELMQNEIDLYNINKKRFEASINVLKEQLIQRKNDLEEAYKNLESTQENYELINKEMEIKIPLVRERIISKVELIDLKRKQNDIDAEIKKIKGSIPSLKSSINEIKKSMEETKESYFSSTKDELIMSINDLNQVKKELDFFNEKVTQTNVLAPNDGIVNKINIKTKGEAISSGTIIAEIIPDSDYLLAEVKVDPSDIGFLYIGQKVRLKLRAYDFSLYGAVNGEISYISANTLKNIQENEKEKYIVHIKSKNRYLNNNKKLEIKPGMTIDADIITGKKRVLNYILKPIVKSLDI